MEGLSLRRSVLATCWLAQFGGGRYRNNRAREVEGTDERYSLRGIIGCILKSFFCGWSVVWCESERKAFVSGFHVVAKVKNKGAG